MPVGRSRGVSYGKGESQRKQDDLKKKREKKKKEKEEKEEKEKENVTIGSRGTTSTLVLLLRLLISSSLLSHTSSVYGLSSGSNIFPRCLQKVSSRKNDGVG